MAGDFAKVLIIFMGINGGHVEGLPLNNTNSDSNPLSNLDKTTNNLADTALNCTVAASKAVAVGIKDQLDTVNLIKFYLHIQDSENPVKGDSSSLMFQPFTWMRTTGRPGTTLLLLRPELEFLSLTTLEIGVATMKVDLKQIPSNCLQNLNDSSIEKVFRLSALNGFQDSSSVPIIGARSTDSICNMHIIDNSGYSEFRYICCQKNELDQVSCEYLHEDTWLSVLFVVINILKILLVLFSPIFVPDSWYRLRHVATPYKHKCPDGTQITLNTVITSDPDKHITNSTKTTFLKSKFENMEHFATTIDSLEPEVMHRLTLNEITLQVEYGRLLPADYAPVGLFRTLYDSFVQCQIRERESVNDCCNTDICIKLPCKKTYTFYKFMNSFMKFVLLLLFAVPWILRVAAYYKYEHEDIDLRKQEANRRGLSFSYPGNVTLLLTPTHFLFIAIYILLAVVVFAASLLGTIGEPVREKLKFVTRKCFRDMREMSTMDIIGWAVKLILYPFTKCGIVGCVSVLLWPFMLPLILVVSAFHLFPTINITVRLLLHFVTYIIPHKRPFSFIKKLGKSFNIAEVLFPESSSPESIKKEETIINSCTARLQQLFIIVCCILSMYSVIFLVTEMLSIVVEIFVYTMMGLILNARKLMSYVSLFVLLILYGNKTFGNVTESFLAFNKKMNGILMDLAIDKVESIIYTHSDSQDNMAFRVKTEKCVKAENPGELIKNAEDEPRWNVARLLFFFDKFDQPLIPAAFYFKACKMSYFAAPGTLLLRYLSAALEFCTILLFLMFVLIVVLAFGDNYQISATNQLLVTVAGGLLPLLLKTLIFKSYSVPDIEKGSIHFQVALTELLDPYDETWPAFDIDVEKTEKVENGDDLPIDLLIDIRNTPLERIPETGSRMDRGDFI